MAQLIFGCGYLGQRVAGRWVARKQQTFAVTRVTERAEQLQRDGIKPIVADITQPSTLTKLPACHTVLFAVGYDRQSGQSLRTVYVDGIKNVLNALPSTVQRFLYISSTGVYGQDDGSLVDEESPCQPRREGGQACLEAEQILQASSWGARSIILRLAGIYGPGRVPRAEALQQQEPLPGAPDGYLNLVHVEDAADIVVVAGEKALPPNLYVVSDGHPVLRHDYYRYAAQLLEAPQPQFRSPDPESRQGQRGTRGKRSNPQKLLRDLPVRFQFPSYREGLADAVRQ